jgi:plasmid rolling circle replication initiator protein Rep
MSLKSGKVKRLDKKKTYQNKYFKMSRCAEFWLWDKYELNEKLVLKKVNFCGYSECPICRKIQLAKARIEIRPKLEKLVHDGYKMIHLTLTIPSCKGDDLRENILKMNRAFKRIYQWLNLSIEDRYGYKDRYIDVVGAYRAFEVTCNYNYYAREYMYHPHFHVILVCNRIDPERNQKNYEGDWSIKRQQYDMYSDIDFQIMKLWTLSIDGDDIRNIKTYDSVDKMLLLKELLYRCYTKDVVDDKAALELLKYTYKDSQIKNYEQFKTIVNALYALKKRQGYGCLYGDFDYEGYKVEDEEEKKDILKEILKIEETPQIVLTRITNLLTKEYQRYEKISTRESLQETENIDD